MHIRLISGETVRNRLKELGMSQKKLADMVGADRTHVTHFISENHPGDYMKVEKQLKIAEVLNIDISDSDDLEKALENLIVRKKVKEKQLMSINHDIDKLQRMISKKKEV